MKRCSLVKKSIYQFFTVQPLILRELETNRYIRAFLHRLSRRNKAKQETYFLPARSLDTVNFFLPFARLLDNTDLPLASAILALKPCLFFLFLCEGWNVLFIVFIYFLCLTSSSDSV